MDDVLEIALNPGESRESVTRGAEEKQLPLAH
jgi:hypothetical protein